MCSFLFASTEIQTNYDDKHHITTNYYDTATMDSIIIQPGLNDYFTIT